MLPGLKAAVATGRTDRYADLRGTSVSGGSRSPRAAASRMRSTKGQVGSTGNSWRSSTGCLGSRVRGHRLKKLPLDCGRSAGPWPVPLSDRCRRTRVPRRVASQTAKRVEPPIASRFAADAFGSLTRVRRSSALDSCQASSRRRRRALVTATPRPDDSLASGSQQMGWQSNGLVVRGA
jgi:hypothetical protein